MLKKKKKKKVVWQLVPRVSVCQFMEGIKIKKDFLEKWLGDILLWRKRCERYVKSLLKLRVDVSIESGIPEKEHFNLH